MKLKEYMLNQDLPIKDLNFSAKNDLLAKIRCIETWDDSSNRTITECHNDFLSGPIFIVLIVSIIVTPLVIYVKKFEPKKSDNSNKFDLISFIEELKENKFPDASIGESFVKGSYVILKDLNGKTIAEIKLPELNKGSQYTKNKDETLILNDEISSDEKTSYPKFWEVWRRDYWQEKD